MRSDQSEVSALIVALRDEDLLSEVQQELRRQAAHGDFSIIVTNPDETLPRICTRFRPCILLVEGDLICSAPWALDLRKLAITDATILAVVSDRLETTALRLLHYGCSGVIDSRTVVQDLPKAVSCLLKGEYWVNRRLLSAYCRSLRAEMQSDVSKREREIWELIAAGESNGAIALKLHVSPQTVHWHIRGLYRKLGATSRKQAIQLWFGFDAKMAARQPEGNGESPKTESRFRTTAS